LSATLGRTCSPVPADLHAFLAAPREFTHLSVFGRVVGITLDRDFAGVDEFARHYNGRDYPNHDVPGYVLRVEIERWHLFGDPASDEPPAGPRP
jgi:hypothetical protein